MSTKAITIRIRRSTLRRVRIGVPLIVLGLLLELGLALGGVAQGIINCVCAVLLVMLSVFLIRDFRDDRRRRRSKTR